MRNAVFLSAGVFLLFPFLVSSAQFGIGVSPAVIEIEAKEFPATATLFVKNTAEAPGVIEILLAGPLAEKVTLSPSKLAVAAGETAKVLVEADGPLQGRLAVVSIRETPEGLSTGTGIEVPLKVSEVGTLSSFLRASLRDLPFPSLPVALGVLVLFVLLRLLLFLVREEKKAGRVARGVLLPGKAVSFE